MWRLTALVVLLSVAAYGVALLFELGERPIVVGAFLGALFPFLFLVGKDLIRREEERQRRSRTAVVTIQHMANMAVSTAASNAQQLDSARRRALESDLESGELKVNLIHVSPIEGVERQAILDLLNIDLVNAAFQFNILVAAANDNSALLEKLYRETIGHREPKTLEVMHKQLARWCENLGENTDIQIGVCKAGTSLVAATQVMLQRMKLPRYIRRIARQEGTFPTECELASHHKKVMEERARNRAKPLAYETLTDSEREYWLTRR